MVDERENPLGCPSESSIVYGRVISETGIVATPDNYGKMAHRPVNQELLDWSPVDFMNSWLEREAAAQADHDVHCVCQSASKGRKSWIAKSRTSSRKTLFCGE